MPKAFWWAAVAIQRESETQQHLILLLAPNHHILLFSSGPRVMLCRIASSSIDRDGSRWSGRWGRLLRQRRGRIS